MRIFLFDCIWTLANKSQIYLYIYIIKGFYLYLFYDMFGFTRDMVNGLQCEALWTIAIQVNQI